MMRNPNKKKWSLISISSKFNWRYYRRKNGLFDNCKENIHTVIKIVCISDLTRWAEIKCLTKLRIFLQRKIKCPSLRSILAGMLKFSFLLSLYFSLFYIIQFSTEFSFQTIKYNKFNFFAIIFFGIIYLFLDILLVHFPKINWYRNFIFKLLVLTIIVSIWHHKEYEIVTSKTKLPEKFDEPIDVNMTDLIEFDSLTSTLHLDTTSLNSSQIKLAKRFYEIEKNYFDSNILVNKYEKVKINKYSINDKKSKFSLVEIEIVTGVDTFIINKIQANNDYALENFIKFSLQKNKPIIIDSILINYFPNASVFTPSTLALFLRANEYYKTHKIYQADKCYDLLLAKIEATDSHIKLQLNNQRTVLYILAEKINSLFRCLKEDLNDISDMDVIKYKKIAYEDMSELIFLSKSTDSSLYQNFLPYGIYIYYNLIEWDLLKHVPVNQDSLIIYKNEKKNYKKLQILIENACLGKYYYRDEFITQDTINSIIKAIDNFKIKYLN